MPLRRGNEMLATHITKNMKLFEVFIYDSAYITGLDINLSQPEICNNSTYYSITMHKLLSLECVKYSSKQKYSKWKFSALSRFVFHSVCHLLAWGSFLDKVRTSLCVSCRV